MGSEFHIVGAASQKVWVLKVRFVRGTLSSFAEEERRALVRTYRWRRFSEPFQTVLVYINDFLTCKNLPRKKIVNLLPNLTD